MAWLNRIVNTVNDELGQLGLTPNTRRNAPSHVRQHSLPAPGAYGTGVHNVYSPHLPPPPPPYVAAGQRPPPPLPQRPNATPSYHQSSQNPPPPAPPPLPPRPGQPQTTRQQSLPSTGAFSQAPPPGIVPNAHAPSIAPPPPATQPTDPLIDICTPFYVIRPSGSPAPEFSYCPKDNMVNWGADWWHVAGHDDWLMCTACHRRWFGALPSSPMISVWGESGRCRFYKPRAKVLAADAARTGNMAPLAEYVARRKTVPDCSEEIFGCENISTQWWTPGGDTHACGACYEDIVLATQLGQGWTAYTTGGNFKCDMAKVGGLSYIGVSRRRGSLQEWRSGLAHFSTLPPCHRVPSSSARWYTTSHPIPGFVMCERCFVDHAKDTAFDQHFAPAASPGWLKQYTCSMDVFGQLSIAIALLFRDFAVFLNCMSMLLSTGVARLEECGSAPHRSCGYNFYYLAGATADFDVCARHHIAMFNSTGLGGYFVPRPASDPTPRTCDVKPGSQRHVTYILACAEACQKGLVAPMRDCIVRLDTTPPCPGFDTRAGGTWYGFPDLRICPECWTDYGSKTPLAAQSEQGVVISTPTLCGLSSYRMRVKWLDAGSDPTSLLAFARNRLQIYNTTYPELKQLQTTQQQKVAQAALATNMALRTQGRGAALSIISDSGYRYGNDSDGWYDNTTSLDAARQWDQSQAMLHDAYANEGRINVLQAKWSQVA